jgi:hypothetical protein
VKAEYQQRVDVRRWKQDGLMPAQSSKAVLTFSIDGREVTQHIWLTHTPCNYGGTRAWFTCPRCRRRAAVLHLRGGAGFMCSKCGRVKHASQSEDSLQRAWRAQRKIEERLGERQSRPKGMHQRTYDGLMDKIQECEARKDSHLRMFMAKFFPMAGRR